MEVSTTVHITIKKSDRRYEFVIPVGAPFGEAYDACFEVLDYLQQKAGEALQKNKRPAEQYEELV